MKRPNYTPEQVARAQGFNAVAAHPFHAPRNPYDEDTDPTLYEAWEAGADEAGISSIYHNGELKL